MIAPAETAETGKRRPETGKRKKDAAGAALPVQPPRTEPVFDAANIQLQRRMRFNPLRMADPETLAQYLDQFDIGILNLAARLWEAMCKRDDTLSFVKPQLEASIASKPWGVFLKPDVNPVEGARHKAALEYFYAHVRVTDAFDRNIRGGRHKLIEQMMSAASYMYAVHHFVWKPQPGVMIAVDAEGAAPVPALTAELEQVPLMYFENTSGTLRFLPMGGYGIEGEELDWENEWMCTTGRGIMFAASIAYIFKRMTFQDWTIFNERYAQNKVLGQTPATQDSPQGQAMAAVIANFNGDQGIALYESQPGDKPPISLIGPEGTASVEIWNIFLERQDAKITVMYRGSDRANEAGDKNQNGITAQMDETGRLERSYEQSIGDACEQGIDRKVIRYCFGEGVEPLAYFGLPNMEEDEAKEVRESAGFLADRGVLVEAAELSNRLGITTTEDESLALQPSVMPGDGDKETDGDGLDRTANARGGKRRDAAATLALDRLEELINEALRTGNYDPNEDRDENGRWTGGEVVIPDEKWEGSFEEKRDRARKHMRQLKPVTNEQKRVEIHFTGQSAKKTYTGRHTDHEFQSVKGLRKIIQHAEWKSTDPDYAATTHILGWHKYATPVRIGETPYTAEITVKESRDGAKSFHALHLHRLRTR